jgi:hypothetical protein
MAVAAGMLGGVSGASSPTTNVKYTAVTNYKVLSNAYIGANAIRNAVVIGGATPVPTNATTVMLKVTAKGSKAGTLSFYPTGNPGGGGGQTLSWAAGQTVTAEIEQDAGENESLTFKNTSAAAVTVTATLIAFSTEVASGDISGVGGSRDEVLVNDGNGGAEWKIPGHAWIWNDAPSAGYPLGSTYAQVAVVTLPSGRYVYSFSGTVRNADNVTRVADCNVSNSQITLDPNYTGTVAVDGVVFITTNHAFGIYCRGVGMYIRDQVLVAHAVDAFN